MHQDPTGFYAGSDGIPIIDKGPTEELDYPVDWADNTGIGPWLVPTEFIASQSVVADPGINVLGDNPFPAVDPTKSIVWLGGGTIGESYLITVSITTTEGRKPARSFRVNIVAR